MLQEGEPSAPAACGHQTTRVSPMPVPDALLASRPDASLSRLRRDPDEVGEALRPRFLPDRLSRHEGHGFSNQSWRTLLEETAASAHSDLGPVRCLSRTPRGGADEHGGPVAEPCQWPSSSPQRRPRISPLVAIFSPRWWPRISPPTDRLICGVLGEWLDPLAGGRLGEAVAVLPVGDQDVCVMQQPLDGRGREALGHQFVES